MDPGAHSGKFPQLSYGGLHPSQTHLVFPRLTFGHHPPFPGDLGKATTSFIEVGSEPHFSMSHLLLTITDDDIHNLVSIYGGLTTCAPLPTQILVHISPSQRGLFLLLKNSSSPGLSIPLLCLIFLQSINYYLIPHYIYMYFGYCQSFQPGQPAKRVTRQF